MLSQELRNKSVSEIKEMLASKRAEMLDFSKSAIKGSEKNLNKLKFMRKDIARISTILNEKVLLSSLENNEVSVEEKQNE